MIIYTNLKNAGAVKELARVNTEIKAETDVRIEYRLMEADCPQSVYFIVLSDGEESVTVFSGNDGAEAKRLFDALVKGEVTPCTAEDVSRDFLRERWEEK